MNNNYFDLFYTSLLSERCDFIKRSGIKTTDIIEKIQASDYYIVGRERDEFVERRFNPPLFTAAFYYMVMKNKGHISMDEFFEYYLKEHGLEIVNRGLYTNKFEHLKGRLARTYSSLQSELYFQALLEESGKFDGVYYNIDLDVAHKIDVLVRKGNKYIGLELMLDSSKARDNYDRKVRGRKLHFRGIDIHPVTLRLSSKDRKEVEPKKGQKAWLYNDSEIDFLLEQFDRIP